MTYNHLLVPLFKILEPVIGIKEIFNFINTIKYFLENLKDTRLPMPV